MGFPALEFPKQDKLIIIMMMIMIIMIHND